MRPVSNFLIMQLSNSREINTGLRGKEQELTKPGSKVRVFVIPTNEELAIARETLALVK